MPYSREEKREKKRARNKKYYEENIEKCRARNKKYREENIEKVRAREKKYYEENIEKIIARNKKWREENSEKVIAKNKKYREENPERYKKWREENKTEKPSVIYVIECKATNKYYIGQTGVWFERRVTQHKSKLKNDDHSAIEMQDDYNIHGPDAFEYSILKELDSQATEEELLATEGEYINKFIKEGKELYNKFI